MNCLRLILRSINAIFTASISSLSNGRSFEKYSMIGSVFIFQITYNCFGYEQLCGLALNFASTHQTENPRDTSVANWRKQFSDVTENKQLLIATVGGSYSLFFIIPV